MRTTKEYTKATMEDVGRRAGVSVTTVSRVLNSSGRVSSATAERVWQAADALGYQINHIAKSLRVGATHVVAVIVGDLGNPFYADFIKGVELAAQSAQLSVSICAGAQDDEGARRQVQMLLSKRVDGVIMWGWCLGPDYIERLLAAGIRVAGIEVQPNPPTGVRSLTIDFRSGMRDVVAHLVSLGHRRIGYLWDRHDQPATPESRFFCFREAMREHGLPLQEEWIAVATGGQRPEIGQSAALDLFGRVPELTALVCHNDLLALGALQAAKQTGMTVPDRIAIVGVDDIFTARFTEPPLTTLALPRSEAGSMALRWLLESQTENLPPPQIVPRLIVRGSTGPAIA